MAKELTVSDAILFYCCIAWLEWKLYFTVGTYLSNYVLIIYLLGFNVLSDVIL